MVSKENHSKWLAELAQLKERTNELENLLHKEGISVTSLPGFPFSEESKHYSTYFKEVLQEIPDIAFHKDMSGRYITANQAYCEFLGTTPKEIIGKTDFDLVPNEMAEKYWHEDQRILSGADSILVIKENVHLYGHNNYLSYRKVPFKNNNGDIVGLICTGFDISEYEQVEIELERERRLMRTLIDIIPDQIYVRDRNCRFILCNKSDARVMGVSDPETLMGMGDEDFYPPEQAARYQADDRYVMDLGQSLINREEPLTAADGQQHWLLTTKVPLRDEQGDVIGLVGISRDISELKQAEKEFLHVLEENRASRAFLQNILDTSLSYICWKDRELRFLGCNLATARLFGLANPEDIIGKTDKDLPNTPEQIEAYNAADRRILETGLPEYHIIENGINASGNLVWFDTNKIPLHNAAGEVVGILVFIEDITRQKTILDQIQQLNAELESFSYSVSHDLGAPLRRIKGFSNLILEDYADLLDDKGRTYFDKILSSTEYMSQLIENLLRLSKVTQGNLQICKVDLCALARDILVIFQEDNPDRKVEIILPEKLVVRADEPLIRIALENIIGNAWKFTSKTLNARIELGTFEKDHKKVFFVRDNGAGFDMENVNKLFGAFQRLHSDKEFSGTGIGLALAQRIVRRHGGMIWAEGEVDHGAVFYFTLDV